MKIAFTSDWQTSTSNLERCESALTQFIEILKDEKCDYAVHLGDLKEAFNNVDIRVTNFLVDATRRIREHCKFIVLLGNHDLIMPRDNVPSILPVMEAAGATVISDPTVYSLAPNLDLFAVPYIRDETALKEALRLLSERAHRRNKVRRLLIFHHEINDCKQSVWRKGSGITLGDMHASSYDYCLGGHIHYAHRPGNNVQYVGSPFCVDWGEVNQSKSFTLVSFNKDVLTVSTIPSSIPGWYDPSAPEFHSLKSWDMCHVRISVQVKTDPARELNQARKDAEKKYPGAVIHTVPVFSKSAQPTQLTARTDDDLIREYLKTQTLPPDTDAEEVLHYLRKHLTPGGLGVQGLEFESVTAENVLSFSKATLSMNTPGITLVTAKNLDRNGCSNGGGKSSLLSLPWVAMFGRTLKKQKHDKWACRHNSSKAVARLAFRLADKRQCVISRGRRPAFTTVTLDNVDVTLGDANQTQEYVEVLTGLTWDVLTNSIYIGQNEIGSVFGTEKERKELFSRLLGLERFLNAQESLTKRVRAAKDAIQTLDEDIAAAQATIAEATLNLSSIKESLREAPAPDPDKINKLQLEATAMDLVIKALQNQQRDVIDPWLSRNQKAYESLLKWSATAEGKREPLIEQIDAAQALTLVCPTCGSPIDSFAQETRLKKLQMQVQSLDKEVSCAEKAMQANRESCVRTKSKANELTCSIYAKQCAVAEYQREIITLRQRVEAYQRLQTVVAAKRERVRQAENLLQVHTRASECALLHKQFVEFCMNTVGRNGLPAYLCSVVAPQLNAAAIKYSSLFSEGEIGLRFEISNGDIDVHINNPFGGAGMEDQSMGETRLAALIAAFSFREVLVQHGLLILDEPGEGLDEGNARRFAQGLNQAKADLGTIFVVTHNAYIQSELMPDRHIEIVKEHGISRCVQTV